jgi:hypothetical protein
MKLSTIVLAIALAAPSTLALASPMNLSDPKVVASQGEGREMAAPPWSFACLTDHGPADCGEPMWIYGATKPHARSRHSGF